MFGIGPEALLILLLPVLLAIWVIVDSNRLHVESGRRWHVGSIPTWAWALLTIVCWVVALPAYLITRSQFISNLQEHDRRGG